MFRRKIGGHYSWEFLLIQWATWISCSFLVAHYKLLGFINPNSYKKPTDVVETSGFFFDLSESDYNQISAKHQGILPTCLSLNEVAQLGSKNFQGGFPNVGIRGGMGERPLRF